MRRDLFLLMMAYSDRKDHLTAEELVNFLRNEQKVRGSESSAGGLRADGRSDRDRTFFPPSMSKARTESFSGTCSSPRHRPSCPPRGICSAEPIYLTCNWFVSREPFSPSLQPLTALFVVFLTVSPLPYNSVSSHHVIFTVSSLQCLVSVLFRYNAA